MPVTREPTLALEQARARWGEAVAVAGLFRPGPDPQARTALSRAVSRRGNRRRADLPARILVALDAEGRALLCPYLPDPQGGHPEGDDLYLGDLGALGAVSTGPRSLIALLDDDRPVVLESVWLDHDAATVTALLTGEPLPEDPDLDVEPAGDEQGEPEGSAYTETLLLQAEAAQARADSLRALAAAAQAEAGDEEEAPPPPPPA